MRPKQKKRKKKIWTEQLCHLWPQPPPMSFSTWFQLPNWLLLKQSKVIPWIQRCKISEDCNVFWVSYLPFLENTVSQKYQSLTALNKGSLLWSGLGYGMHHLPRIPNGHQESEPDPPEPPPSLQDILEVSWPLLERLEFCTLEILESRNAMIEV